MRDYRRVIALLNIVLQVSTDLAGTGCLAVRRHGALTAQILMLRRQLAMYARTRGEAAASRSAQPRRTRVALPILQLARRPGGDAPRDDDPLAPRGLAAVLAPEVSTRSTHYPEASTGSNPAHGERESRLGRGTHCQRASSETRNSGLATHPSGKLFPVIHPAGLEVTCAGRHSCVCTPRGIIACDFLVVVGFIATSPHIRAPVGPCSKCAKRSASEERYQYLLHDRDSIFATHLDESMTRLGITVLQSPPRCPKAKEYAA